MRTLVGAAVVWMLALMGGALAQQRPPESVEADASTRQVAITSSFTGTEILVFGTVENSRQPSPEAGTYDVIVVVEGQAAPAVVREKSRVAGIWINTSSMRFDAVPSYYAIASTRPIDEIAGNALLDAKQIGFDHIHMSPSGSETAEGGAVQTYKQALIRLKEGQGVYVKRDFGVTFIGRSLFRATISLPPNVPVGPLTARVFLFKEGRLLGEYESRVGLRREGIERFIHEFALSQPLAYGIVTVLLAAGAGLAAAFAFRKPA
ncbi:TIGR02186 family protein [Hyphomicrobium sp.]|uniref:TIGR02186 family protein n=1 Tax=Hyphomicrobium sp. TaxID=82 RepID=UPI002D7793D4|nr:TIGR02186 family protein [Hyphomicrobium sp.]HET6390210.1 TIGR02186 family protein [Hyphomicrobium sp.]